MNAFNQYYAVLASKASYGYTYKPGRPQEKLPWVSPGISASSKTIATENFSTFNKIIMLRKNIYRWHRILSLTIALPVVLWAASGFMHPVMTTIRPRVATQFLPAAPLDTNRIKLPLRDALQKNSISNFHNFRLVHIDTNWFYQVQKTANETPLYLSVINGKKLANGDALYAQYLAKLFLEGPPVPIATATQYASISHEDMMTDKAVTAAAEHDCCDAATACILGNETGSPVAGIALLRSFDANTKFINRLLPVYKVKFDRPDGIRLYVETTQDRFAFAMDNKRAVFDKIFGLFHTWEWMNFWATANTM